MSGKAVLIVAPSTIEPPLIARRLGGWGARTCLVPDDTEARAILPERHFDTLLIDHALGLQAASALLREANVASRIVLVTPAERHELAAFRQAGFTGYLVKPVRAASLAARFADENLGMDAPPDQAPEAAQVKGRAILVAEDNDINALLARALLTRLGHRPTVVHDGAAAVEAFLAATDAPYDLVLMDVHMPQLDGIEATRRIRAAEAASGRPPTPIIALTANAFGEDRDACLAAGMDDFLVKPLDRERLAEVLAACGRTPSLAA